MVVACIDGGVGNPAQTAADLDAHCKASVLAGFKRHKAYFFTETLPRNAANKVLRRLLRDAATEAQSNERTSFQPVA